VTIPPNQAIPAVGAIVEIRYLYAFRGGSVYQPVYIGERDDIDASACVADQLKFKREESDDDGE
jgi:bifunctional non-homologous end joining protein LigD